MRSKGLNAEAATAGKCAARHCGKSTERRTGFPVDCSCALWSKCQCPAHRLTARAQDDVTVTTW